MACRRFVTRLISPSQAMKSDLSTASESGSCWQLDLDEPGLQALAAALASELPGSADAELLVLGLRGDLGSGKTTFARALIQAAGHPGSVKSPTYGLLESYRLDSVAIHHLDFYRIADPAELEWLGLRELTGVMLIEWPEQGGELTPALDMVVDLELSACGRRRQVSTTAHTSRGRALMKAWRSRFLRSCKE